MPPDPAQPIIDLPADLPARALDFAHSIAPGAFALMLAGLVVVLGVALIRRSL